MTLKELYPEHVYVAKFDTGNTTTWLFRFKEYHDNKKIMSSSYIDTTDKRFHGLTCYLADNNVCEFIREATNAEIQHLITCEKAGKYLSELHVPKTPIYQSYQIY